MKISYKKRGIALLLAFILAGTLSGCDKDNKISIQKNNDIKQESLEIETIERETIESETIKTK